MESVSSCEQKTKERRGTVSETFLGKAFQSHCNDAEGKV